MWLVKLLVLHGITTHAMVCSAKILCVALHDLLSMLTP